MNSNATLDGHILNIVQTKEIAEQTELQIILKDRGYNIPQATLSRRLKKLKIAKVAGTYRLIALHSPNLPLVLRMQVSEFGMIVLHTHPGNASSLGYYLDNKYVSFSQNEGNLGVLGTIAGDDTVLLIIQSKKQVLEVIEMLHSEFPYLKNSSTT